MGRVTQERSLNMTNPRQRALAPAAAAVALAVAATGVFAASHREAPNITLMPKVDSTDFYLFRSYEPGREDFVTLIANYIPLQVPYGGPNYFTMDPDALYEIHIDNDGDAVEDITFSFDFNNRLRGGGISIPVGDQEVAIPLRQAGPIERGQIGALNEIESYSVDIIRGDRRTGNARPLRRAGNNRDTFLKPVDYIGEKTLPAYNRYAGRYIYNVSIPGCSDGRVFVGQRAEGFSVNLGPIFDLVNLIPIEGAIFNSREENEQVFGLFNVTSIALEVPIDCLTGGGEDPVIGAWTTASLPATRTLQALPGFGQANAYEGDFVQVSRLGAPLVNEVVIGLPDKDIFSNAEPSQDAALATYVTNPALPELIEILFGGQLGLPDELAPNNFPRTDLVTAFLTGFPGLNQPQAVTPSEMLRLNTAIPPTPRGQQSPFGVVDEDLAGFPNGRRPGDDVVDIALRVVMGRLCHPLPLATELGVDGAVEDSELDDIDLGLCAAADAPVGLAPFIDGAPISGIDFRNTFPYLNAPIPGAIVTESTLTD